MESEPASIDDGSYFPNPSPVSNAESPAGSTPKSASTSELPDLSAEVRSTTTIDRMPKQEIEDETPRSYEDQDVKSKNDDSINFDEFFDLAVYKNQFLNSQAPSSRQQNLSVFIMISITLLLTFF